MHVVPITNAVNSLPLGQVFSITLTEPPCSNCSWQIDIPYSITLLQVNPLPDYTTPKRQWVLQSNVCGTYTLTFAYRKQCCGKPTLKTDSFTFSFY